MTNFETAVAIIFYLFAWGYTIHAFGLDDEDDWVIRLLTLVAAATLGIVYFPIILAEDIWYKLNNYGKDNTARGIRPPQSRKAKIQGEADGICEGY